MVYRATECIIEAAICVPKMKLVDKTPVHASGKGVIVNELQALNNVECCFAL